VPGTNDGLGKVSVRGKPGLGGTGVGAILDISVRRLLGHTDHLKSCRPNRALMLGSMRNSSIKREGVDVQADPRFG
jgi:hypothetical protein